MKNETEKTPRKARMTEALPRPEGYLIEALYWRNAPEDMREFFTPEVCRREMRLAALDWKRRVGPKICKLDIWEARAINRMRKAIK